jgi:ABC-type uncharacterized transport system ATPase subunit
MSVGSNGSMDETSPSFKRFRLLPDPIDDMMSRIDNEATEIKAILVDSHQLLNSSREFVDAGTSDAATMKVGRIIFESTLEEIQAEKMFHSIVGKKWPSDKITEYRLARLEFEVNKFSEIASLERIKRNYRLHYTHLSAEARRTIKSIRGLVPVQPSSPRSPR